jgi:hypothetical protein
MFIYILYGILILFIGYFVLIGFKFFLVKHYSKIKGGDKTTNNCSFLYKKHYLLILQKLRKTSFGDNAEFELKPALVVICNLAIQNSGKDREIITKYLVPWIKEKYIKNEEENKEFYKRIALYEEIIKGMLVRGEWLMGNLTPKEDKNEIIDIGIAMGDILVNSACADDYEGAPLMINDANKMMEFSVVMVKEVLEELVEFHNRIYQL